MNASLRRSRKSSQGPPVRRRVTPATARLLACVLVAGCGGERDAGLDAGGRTPDTPLRERPDAPRDATWDGGPEPEWRVQLDPGPAYGTACTEWETAEHPHPDPDLAPPGSPRILWEWDPMDEPMVRALPRFRGHRTRGLAIGPTGTVWAITPDDSAVAGVGRDGALRWLRVLASGEPEVSYIHERAPAIAPDGSGFLFYRAPRTLVRIADDGRTLWSLPVGAGPPGGPSAEEVAIGPRGRVYVREGWTTWEGGDARLVALCADGQVLWELRLFRRAPGGDWENAGPSQVRVLEDGRLLALTPFTGDVWLIDEAGAASMAGADPSIVLATSPRLGDVNGARMLIQDFLPPDVKWTRAVTLDGGREWEDFSGPDTHYRFDPAGRVWRFAWSAETARFLATNFEADGFSSVDLEGCHADIPTFAADGSFLCSDGVPGEAALGRLAPTGARSWRLVLGESGAGMNEFVHDVDGRIYAVLAGPASADAYGPYGRIVAVQSDVTPPRGALCLARGLSEDACNRHRNSWVHDYGP